MKSDRHYIRVYDDDLRRDYPRIWRDDRALSTWLRLLSVADKMWPTSPELPRTISSAALRLLVDAGLVELLPDDCYRIRGHDAERTARSNAASNAAASRWGNAASNAETMPRRERDENETNTPPPQVGRRANGTNPRAIGTNPRAQGKSPRQEREREKRAAVPESVHDILRRAAAGGHE